MAALSPTEETELDNLVNNNDTIINQPPTTSNLNVAIAATTVNGTLATDFEAGQVIDEITLKKTQFMCGDAFLAP